GHSTSSPSSRCSVSGPCSRRRLTGARPPAPRSGRSATSMRATWARPRWGRGGREPRRPELAAIAALRDRTALARALGAELRTDVDSLNCTHYHTSRLFGLWVAPDLNQPSVYAGYLFQGGLGMPDREYYLSTNPKMVATRDGYRAHVARVLTLAGIGDAERTAARIVDLETRIARAHATRADSPEVR